MLINKILETKNESRERFIKIRKQKIIMNWVLTISTTGFIIFALLFAFKKINLNSQEFIIGLLIYLFLVLIFIGFHFYIFKTNNLYKKFVTLYDQEEIKTEVLEELTIKRKKKFESKHALKLDQQKNLEKKRINKLKHTQEMTQIKTEAALVEEQNLESEIELEKIRERVALKRANIEKMIMDYLNTLKQDLNSQNTTKKQKYTSTTQIKLIQLENNLKNASDNDFYSILGITKDAEFEDIKKAFKNKAKQYHPDLNMGDDTYFIKIKNAYENILKENDLNNE